MPRDAELNIPEIKITGRTASSDEIYYRIELSSEDSRSTTVTTSLSEIDDSARSLVRTARAIGFAVLGREKEALIQRISTAIGDTPHDAIPTFPLATATGWTSANLCFVTPRRKYGAQAKDVEVAYFEVPAYANYSRSGNLDSWVAAFAPTLEAHRPFTFCAAVALMPPLLALAEYPGVTIVFCSATSTGKSTLLNFMGSLRGGAPQSGLGFQASFRVTSNGLEKLIPSANDSLLLLDDIRSIPGSDRVRAELLRDTLYFISGGKEKLRHTATQAPLSFRTVAATADNFSLGAIMAQGGLQNDPSMAVRLIQIPLSSSLGVLDSAPDKVSPSKYIERIERLSFQNYGYPLDVFLKRLLADLDTDREGFLKALRSRLERARKRLQGGSGSGAESRVSKYFALAYAAGCLAIEYGILPISRSWLRESVQFAYDQHSSVLPAGASYDPVALLRKAIKPRLNSMLSIADARSAKAVMAAPGVIDERHRQFLFTTEQFAGLLPSGFSSKRACDSLKERGLLIHDEGDEPSSAKNTTKRRFGKDRLRVYTISMSILGER